MRRCAGGAALAVPLLGLLLLAPLACGEDRAAQRGADVTRAALEELRARRAQLDRTVWADEVLAQGYEAPIVALWDALLRAERRGSEREVVETLAGLDFGALRIGSLQPAERLENDIESAVFGEPSALLTPADWAALVRRLAAEGYRLAQSDWQHARFVPPRDASPARSQVALVLHLLDAERERRLIVEGVLEVEWSERRDGRGHPVPASIDATGLRVLARHGPPAFERILSWERRVAGGLSGIHPILLYDLDGDGLSEIVPMRSSRVLWNEGGGRFREEPLLLDSYGLAETAFGEAGVIADLDRDGKADLLAARARGDLALYRGDDQGRLEGEPLVTPRFPRPLRAPSVLALGDVDADGDLDVWLAQYKPPYLGGQMPHPYYDANDGFPAYLFANDGEGRLAPITKEAGLAGRRFRRTYASSFVDLDADGDLDLLVVSDFAGIDVYHNDGSGQFADAGDRIAGDRHLFGMSASFADYDLDGRLDFFVAGMDSTAARRIDAMGLGPPERPDMQRMRMRMAFGNRMYLGGEDGFRESDFREQVTRTGWTWGTSAFDFDNDGDPDLFAANGHKSGESVRDYCVNFWAHDIYDGNSKPNEALGILFAERMNGFATGKESWNGHQKNRLLMNRGGESFVEVAFLMGVSDEFDSRSAVSDDVDGDGRVDLVLVEDRALQGQRLHVYRNRLESDGAWIGVRLRERAGRPSPVGASVTLRTPERTYVGRVLTGDTLMGQHAPTLHFGLGRETRVDSIEVRWIGGATRVIREPALGRYHLVEAPEEGAGS